MKFNGAYSLWVLNTLLIMKFLRTVLLDFTFAPMDDSSEVSVLFKNGMERWFQIMHNDLHGHVMVSAPGIPENTITVCLTVGALDAILFPAAHPYLVQKGRLTFFPSETAHRGGRH